MTQVAFERNDSIATRFDIAVGNALHSVEQTNSVARIVELGVIDDIASGAMNHAFKSDHSLSMLSQPSA